MPNKSGQPTDYPRDVILQQAQQAVRGKNADVYFKFTCCHCGQRCTFDEPNKLWESGECSKCGAVTEIEKAGFMLVMKIGVRKDGDEQGSAEGPGEGDGTDQEKGKLD